MYDREPQFDDALSPDLHHNWQVARVVPRGSIPGAAMVWIPSLWTPCKQLAVTLGCKVVIIFCGNCTFSLSLMVLSPPHFYLQRQHEQGLTLMFWSCNIQQLRRIGNRVWPFWNKIKVAVIFIIHCRAGDPLCGASVWCGKRAAVLRISSSYKGWWFMHSQTETLNCPYWL
jgi:hypothetical protein